MCGDAKRVCQSISRGRAGPGIGRESAIQDQVGVDYRVEQVPKPTKGGAVRHGGCGLAADVWELPQVILQWSRRWEEVTGLVAVCQVLHAGCKQTPLVVGATVRKGRLQP